MNASDITVAIPVKTAEWCLRHSLPILERQTVQPLEYLFCYSPSKDNTLAMLHSFKERMKEKSNVEIIVDDNNRGTGYARRVLTDNAKGEYISWIDADHLVSDNWIASLIHLTNKFDFDGIDGDILEIEPEQVEQHVPYEVDIVNSKLIVPKKNRQRAGRCLLKKEKVVEVGNYDDFFRRGQDQDMTIRLKAAKANIMFCGDLYYFHIGLYTNFSTKGFVRNAITRGVYLSFIYKYGIRFIFHSTEQLLEFLIKAGTILFGFLSPLLLFVDIKISTLSLLLFFIGMSAIFIVTVLEHGFNRRLFLIQFGNCLGEYVTLYYIYIRKGNRQFGYGSKYLQGRNKT